MRKLLISGSGALRPTVWLTQATRAAPSSRRVTSGNDRAEAEAAAESSTSPETTRYRGPHPDELDPRQREIRDYVLATRPRTGMKGPFGPWLAAPDIAGPAVQLGKAVRYGTSLSPRESELVILLTAAKTGCTTEFEIHAAEAARVGVSDHVVGAIPRGAAGVGGAGCRDGAAFTVAAVREAVVPRVRGARERAIVAFAAELLATDAVSEGTYRRTRAALGGGDGVDRALVEVVSVAGYYTFVAYTLNAFRIPHD